MYVIMGAHGHVGSEVINTLVNQGHEVIAVSLNPEHAADWERQGVKVELADVNQPDSLRRVFRLGRRAFLLNPPAPVDSDTDLVERHTVACILEALGNSDLEKAVVESAGGARPGERLGDLNVLWGLEEGIRKLRIPAAINRAAYYMSN